jgi:hypothetical protein
VNVHARDDRELAHELMAVLRTRYESSTGRRVFRGEMPQSLGRGAAPHASSALLDIKTGRVWVAAEAVDPLATRASVQGACERALVLARYERAQRDESEGRRELAEVWICAPADAHAELAVSHPLADVKWVPYEVMPTWVPAISKGPPPSAVGGRPEDHAREVDDLVARREKIARRIETLVHAEPIEGATQSLRVTHGALDDSRDSTKLAERYLDMVADLRGKGSRR